MSYRMERVGSEMQKCISDVIRFKVHDPRISNMVSVLNVSVTKDMKSARVWVSIFGDKTAETFDALKRTAGFIRKEVAASLRNYRSVPEFTFVLDTSADYGAHIGKLLGDIKIPDEDGADMDGADKKESDED